MKRKKEAAQPRIPKTREEILKDMKSNADFVRRMDFTKNKLYPAVIKASKNVEDATRFLYQTSTLLTQKFLGLMKEKKFEELDIVSILDKNDAHYPEYVDLFKLFEGQSVYEAKEYLEGMKSEIDLFSRELMQKTKLEDLPTRWIDDL